MPFEEELGDQHRQKDECCASSPSSQSTCDSDGNGSPKELPRLLNIKAPADIFHPECDLLPALLEYLSVPDILAWRVTSEQTRSPEVLLRHVAELGRLDKSAAIVEFADGMERIIADSEPFPDDVECKKRFKCHFWCLALARTDTTHFAEDYVHQTVSKNLTDLLLHCLDADKRVRYSANNMVRLYATGSLGFVQELITDTVLSQMEDSLSTGGEMKVTWNQMRVYMKHLEPLLRGLTKHRRQHWASLLVKVLRSLQSASAPHGATRQQVVVDYLKLLWYADDDPNRTYAEEKEQLLAFSDSPNFQVVKKSLRSFLYCC